MLKNDVKLSKFNNIPAMYVVTIFPKELYAFTFRLSDSKR